MSAVIKIAFTLMKKEIVFEVMCNQELITDKRVVVEVDPDEEMMVTQVLSIGDVVEGVQFNCQFYSNMSYQMFIYRNMDTIHSSERVNVDQQVITCMIDGNEYTFKASVFDQSMLRTLIRSGVEYLANSLIAYRKKNYLASNDQQKQGYISFQPEPQETQYFEFSDIGDNTHMTIILSIDSFDTSENTEPTIQLACVNQNFDIEIGITVEFGGVTKIRGYKFNTEKSMHLAGPVELEKKNDLTELHLRVGQVSKQTILFQAIEGGVKEVNSRYIDNQNFDLSHFVLKSRGVYGKFKAVYH